MLRYEETKFYEEVVGSGRLLGGILPTRHEDAVEAVAQ